MGKTQCFATFLPFRASASSFFWLFLFSDLLSSTLLFSLTLPIFAFHLSILSEVWLLNFLRSYRSRCHVVTVESLIKELDSCYDSLLLTCGSDRSDSQPRKENWLFSFCLHDRVGPYPMAVSVNESFLKAQTQKTKNFSEFKTQNLSASPSDVTILPCWITWLDRFPNFF